MAKSSSFAGGFDEPAFRDAILNTMLMGMPEDPGQRLTFYWSRDRTYSPEDVAGRPYDWTSAPVTNVPGNPDLPDQAGTDQSLQVPYALEFAARPAGSISTPLGEIDTSRAIATVMDKDHGRIATANYARIGDTRYRIEFDAPPQGLFGVTVWTIFLEAEDES
jgi:hypothetical protein